MADSSDRRATVAKLLVGVPTDGSVATILSGVGGGSGVCLISLHPAKTSRRIIKLAPLARPCFWRSVHAVLESPIGYAGAVTSRVENENRIKAADRYGRSKPSSYPPECDYVRRDLLSGASFGRCGKATGPGMKCLSAPFWGSLAAADLRRRRREIISRTPYPTTNPMAKLPGSRIRKSHMKPSFLHFESSARWNQQRAAR
jgi:hypothetical protein